MTSQVKNVKISAPFFNLKTAIEVSSLLFERFKFEYFSAEDIGDASGYSKTSSNFDRMISSLKMYGLINKDNKSKYFWLTVNASSYLMSKAETNDLTRLIEIFKSPEINNELLEVSSNGNLSSKVLIDYVQNKYNSSDRTSREVVRTFIESMEYFAEFSRAKDEKNFLSSLSLKPFLENHIASKGIANENSESLKKQVDSLNEITSELYKRIKNASKPMLFEDVNLNSGIRICKTFGDTDFYVNISKKLPEISIDNLKFLREEIGALKDRIDYIIWELEQ